MLQGQILQGRQELLKVRTRAEFLVSSTGWSLRWCFLTSPARVHYFVIPFFVAEANSVNFAALIFWLGG